MSLAFGQKARDAGIATSMRSKGDCFDTESRMPFSVLSGPP